MRPAPTRRHCARRARSSRCCAAGALVNQSLPGARSPHASSRTPRRAARRCGVGRRAHTSPEGRSSPALLARACRRRALARPAPSARRTPTKAKSWRRHQLRRRRVRRRRSVGARRVSWRHFFVAAGASDRLRSGRRVSAQAPAAEGDGTAAVVEAVVLPRPRHAGPQAAHRRQRRLRRRRRSAPPCSLVALADSGLAVAFCELVARAAIDVDETPSTGPPPPSAVTAVGARQVADGRRATKQVGSGAPAKRVLWLPPAQAGAAVTAGVAQFVVDLAPLRGCPPPAAAQPPDRVALVAAGRRVDRRLTRLRGGAAAGDARRSRRPSSLLRWGTAPPPSPMERFKAWRRSRAPPPRRRPARRAPASPGYCAVWAALAGDRRAAGRHRAQLHPPRGGAHCPLQRTLVRSARV